MANIFFTSDTHLQILVIYAIVFVGGDMTKLSDLTVLLDETPEAFYWIGFLSADGSIKRSGKRLTLCLAEKDRNHLKKFAEFINWRGTLIVDNKRGAVGVSPMDSKIVPELVKRYGIVENKTYNPPSRIPSRKAKLRFAYAVGFVDGDGTIRHQHKRHDVFLTVKCHASWLHILQEITEVLYPSGPGAGIKNSGYAEFTIAHSTVLKKIKRRIKELSLPALRRKWNLINDQFVSRQELGERRVKELKKLLRRRIKKQNIARKLGVTPSAISNMIRRNNLAS